MGSSRQKALAIYCEEAQCGALDHRQVHLDVGSAWFSPLSRPVNYQGHGIWRRPHKGKVVSICILGQMIA